ncbi:uncharacterized protein A4U43_C05F33310 [Asparagus officinalis]|uniref:Uncharacterized protein n=1 Tax=Asparagus officinalis TaxID=4686 RepID=A0A5P1F0S8_ASPOF|nr:uncharacterized protein A4U43_C05F33310 [Asparagus officinalis]
MFGEGGDEEVVEGGSGSRVNEGFEEVECLGGVGEARGAEEGREGECARVDRVPVNVQSGVLDLTAGSSKFQSPGSKGVLDRVPVDVQSGVLDLTAGSSKFKSSGSQGVLDLSKLKSPGSNGDLSKRQFSGFFGSNGVLDRNKQSTGSSSSAIMSRVSRGRFPAAPADGALPSYAGELLFWHICKFTN